MASARSVDRGLNPDVDKKLAKQNTSQRIRVLKELNDQFRVSNMHLFRNYFDKSQSVQNAQDRAKAAKVMQKHRLESNSQGHLKYKKRTPAQMLLIEKARRDVIFRDKNAANFSVTGEKCFDKEYPVAKVKKVYYNDILSHEGFLDESVKASINDPLLNIAPMSRDIKDVLSNSAGIMHCKVQSIDQALMTYAKEANAEYAEKDAFNESDGDEFESPNKNLPTPDTRQKLIRRAQKQTKRLERIQKHGFKASEVALDEDDADSYDSEIEM